MKFALRLTTLGIIFTAMFTAFEDFCPFHRVYSS